MSAAARRRLDVLQVPDPCPEPWDRMKGDDQTRFCGVCEKNVYNLSAMTAADAEALLDPANGQICVQFYRRADGTVSTVDCAPIRFRRLRLAARRSIGGAAAVLVAVIGLVAGLGVLGGRDREAVGEWIEGTTLGRIAKPMWRTPEVPLGGAPMMIDPPVIDDDVGFEDDPTVIDDEAE